MALNITGRNLRNLLQYLKQFEPASAVITGAVASVAKGDPHGLQVWANKENEPNVVVVSADEKKCKNSYCKKLAFVYSTDNNKDDLGGLLHTPGVLNFKSEIHFRDILKPTFKALTDVISAEDWHVKSMTEILHLTCCDSTKDIPNSQQLDGFYYGEFTPEVATTAANLWVEQGPDISELFYDISRWGYKPTVVYNSVTHKPVAWIMLNFYGPILHFYVEKEFRRSGIGLYVLSEICRRVIEKEGCMIGLIGESNRAVAEIADVIGFRKVDGLEFVYHKVDLTLDRDSITTLSATY